MNSHNLDTYIYLSPTRLSGTDARQLLERILKEFRWFEPRRYGSASLEEHIAPGRVDVSALADWYEQGGSVCVAAETDEDFLLLSHALPGSLPYFSKLTWVTPARHAAQPSWRQTYKSQVLALMRIVQSPLALAAVEEDFDRKTRRWIHEGAGLTRSFTVRNYSEGLAGLFWRNFYGAPFVRLFGDRLAELPPECVQPLEEDLALVQPYEAPQEAGTEEARAREAQLISLLGPECFYDHEKHLPPSRRPVL